MTLKDNRAPLLYHVKLCASFQSHPWTQTGVTVRKRPIRVKIGNFFLPCDLEIWQMTMKNNRAPLPCCFKLCASFHCHWWNQTGNTVRKHPIWVKIDNFFSPVTLKFDVWPWKTIGHGTSSKQHQALCIISSPYVNSYWSYGPETTKWGHDLCDLDLWPLTLTFCMDITFVNGNNSWKFQDYRMTGTLSKKVWRTDGRKEVFFELLGHS